MKRFTKNDYGTIKMLGGKMLGGKMLGGKMLGGNRHSGNRLGDNRHSGNGPCGVMEELEKIRAMLTFMADTTDLLLAATMNEKQQPMDETPYGMHLLFMELISRLDRACDRPHE
ncbi:MAG: hypothetical protein HQL61_14700 [Magnetococcales bacterium]|nr:hypothetical protein [Nitrospirota bacterium]